jgi:adenine phosphoribosyltransferase
MTKELSTQDYNIINNSIRDILDFPKEGIVFKDITTLLNNKEAYSTLMNHLSARYATYKLDYIVGLDARGFIFGAALAYMLGVGFVPVRKKGKLPSKTVSAEYALEYGSDTIELHEDAFEGKKDARVLLIDDLIATGGTAGAAIELIEKIGGKVVENCFIIELTFLDGSSNIKKNYDLYSVIKV